MAGYVPRLYQAVELSPEADTEASIVRFGARRKRVHDDDEDTISRKRLATEASVHFRRQQGPRSFLWRVLDEGHLLEIQCVDLINTSREDSYLTFHASFTSPIIPKGVALADSCSQKSPDALTAFVLTADNDLHTVTIRRELLVSKTAPKDSAAANITTFNINLWKHGGPYKLVAISDLDLVIALTNGGLLRLERDSTDARWRETAYNEGSWADSVRGLVSLKRKQTVRYNDRDIDASTAVSIAAADDLIWTVTLNHTLTAWDRSGKVVSRQDLLGGAYDPDQKSYIMPAEQGELLRVFQHEDSYQMMVYSPKERYFKMYSSKTDMIDNPSEGEPGRIYGMLYGVKLYLPFDELLDTNLWRLADYHITPGKQWKHNRIWARVQSGAASQIFTLKFDLYNDEGGQLASDLEQRWRHGWVAVSESSVRQETLSIAVDDREDSNILFVLNTDSFAPICSSDRLDLLLGNEAVEDHYDNLPDDIKDAIAPNEDDLDTLKLLSAAQKFHSALASSLQESFAALASERALQQPTSSTFFEAADIGRQVSDEAYQQLEQALPGGIGGLTDAPFTDVLELIGTTGHQSGSKNGSLTRFGSQFMVKFGQELLQRDKAVLLSLLALLTFINNDFDQENLQEELHLDKLFELIMLALKQNELRDWLMTTSCLEQGRRSTLFESLFIGDWNSHAPRTLDLDFMSKLTYWCRQWTFAPYKDWQDFTSNVFATLIKNGLYVNANSFERFVGEQAPWSSYLRGRLYLMTGRPDEAALQFSNKGVVKQLSRQKNLDTAGLLTEPVFGAGEDQYLLHIATLFEQQQLYAYTADFAAEALTYINEKQVDQELEQIDKRRGSSNALDQVADARAEIKLLKLNAVWEEITSKLFNAQLLTGQFQQAFVTLAKIKRPELKRSSLQRVIESMLDNGCADLLLDSPPELADDADQILAQLAKSKRTQQILYAYRVKRGDFRGAAEVLWDQLERLRQGRQIRDPDEESLPQAYLVLINTLACCGEGEEWLLAEPIAGGKRKLVTLDQLRKEYVAELDRRSDLQHGRYPLIDHDEMDIL